MNEFSESINKIYNILDSGDFQSANSESFKLLSNLLEKSKNNDKYFSEIYQLGCLFVDLGGEFYDENCVRKGIEIFEINDYSRIFREYSLQYNLGNAKLALFDIISKPNKFKNKLENIELLTEAKNHYWKAYKCANDEEKKGFPQLFVNLANALHKSSRISEALQLYDYVMNIDPDFSLARSNRSDCLFWYSVLSDSLSEKLIQEIYYGYKTALESKKCPEYVKKYLSQKIIEMGNYALIHNTNLDTLEIGYKENNIEFLKHSDYRKFCLENYLSLSEHSLYCWCNGASRDNLTIPLINKPLAGSYIPKMEFLLNRIKSEYSFARRMYYEAITDLNNSINNDLDYESCFSNLLNTDLTGIKIEKLKTSFRMCFGILDKIALGVSELFKLPNSQESVDFTSFWKNPKNPVRWEKLNSIQNPGLVGLFSIATDLNSIKGEWGFFKTWRNFLEHDLFIILEKDDEFDPYQSHSFNKTFHKSEYNIFLEKTKHLLQLVRSSIFSFVFCVRKEALNLGDYSKSSIEIKFERKN